MKYKKYKIKDLPKDFILDKCKLNGQYIISGWQKGFWVKDGLESTQIFPIFFKDYDEIKEWEIEVPIMRTLEFESPNK